MNNHLTAIELQKHKEEQLVVGRYGYEGNELHAIWLKQDGDARPLCTQKKAHSINYDKEATQETVTCHKCKEFGAVR